MSESETYTTHEEQAAAQAKEIERRAHRTRMVLFLLLLLGSTIPLFLNVTVPNKPTAQTVDLYTTLMSIPDGSTILLQSDWTTSTRGESGGEFDALVRILERKNCKLAIYSLGDPQAPQVALNEIAQLNDERKAKGERLYQQWNDYISLGFFPNAEGEGNAMAANLRSAWAGKQDVNASGEPQDVFQSPVLSKVQKVSDVPMLVIVTASNTFNIVIERLSNKLMLTAMVTGVMGPESSVYYSSKQVKGLAVGIKGVYDLETMMENGINTPGPDGKIAVEWPNHPPVKGFPGEINYGKGKLYFPTLHIDMSLLILAVVVGNILMFMGRKKVAQ